MVESQAIPDSFHKYQFDRQIGAGAFGKVFLVTHLELNTKRALKVISRNAPGIGTASFNECKERFHLEAQLGARIHHPNVIGVYDFIPGTDTLGLEMEYAAGGSLADLEKHYQKLGQPIPVEVVIRIGCDLANGLAAIHASGVVHRDIAPKNILLDEHGCAKIADLGLAYISQADLSQREIQGSLAERHPGTPRYMSPEQETTQGHLSPASDVFACGLVLYQLLTGKNYKDLARGTSPRSLRREVPGWLNQAILRMLAWDPAARFENGQVLAEALCKHAGKNQPAAANRTAQNPVRPSPKLSVRLGMGALILLAVSALIGLGAAYFNPAGSGSGTGSSTPAETARMSGDFRVAVAGFTLVGKAENPALGKELAQGIEQRLVQTYNETSPDFSTTIWGPDKVRSVVGTTEDQRAADAQVLTSALGADILVYGVVDVSQPVWQVQPQFFVSTDTFYQAAEINGPSEMGAAFALTGQGEMAHRLEFSSKITPRVKILGRMAVGLAYYSAKNYEKALHEFQSIESLPEWKDYDGKQVLYLLIGNAATKSNNFALAEQYFTASLKLDPEYSRALISQAGVYYMRSLERYNTSENPADADAALLQLSIDTYQKASRAAHQPPLADISTKVHFGLGQADLMLTYSGKDNSFDAAAREFRTVIADYGDGKNPRVRELAAEAHARMGLIYALTANRALAFSEYQSAANLLDDDPERKALYSKRAAENK